MAFHADEASSKQDRFVSLMSAIASFILLATANNVTDGLDLFLLPLSSVLAEALRLAVDEEGVPVMLLKEEELLEVLPRSGRRLLAVGGGVKEWTLVPAEDLEEISGTLLVAPEALR